MLGTLRISGIREREVALHDPDARDVIGYLAIHRRDSITAAALADALWSASDLAGLDRLRHAMRELRRALPLGAAREDPLMNTDGNLQLHPELVHVDLDELRLAIASLHQARERGDENLMRLLSGAIDGATRRSLLDGHPPAAWVSAARDRLAVDLAALEADKRRQRSRERR